MTLTDAECDAEIYAAIDAATRSGYLDGSADLNEYERRELRVAYRAAFAAGAASVPREPTSAMEHAGARAIYDRLNKPGLDQAAGAWRAMHDAATGEKK